MKKSAIIAAIMATGVLASDNVHLLAKRMTVTVHCNRHDNVCHTFWPFELQQTTLSTSTSTSTSVNLSAETSSTKDTGYDIQPTPVTAGFELAPEASEPTPISNADATGDAPGSEETTAEVTTESSAAATTTDSSVSTSEEGPSSTGDDDADDDDDAEENVAAHEFQNGYLVAAGAMVAAAAAGAL